MMKSWWWVAIWVSKPDKKKEKEEWCIARMGGRGMQTTPGGNQEGQQKWGRVKFNKLYGIYNIVATRVKYRFVYFGFQYQQRCYLLLRNFITLIVHVDVYIYA